MLYSIYIILLEPKAKSYPPIRSETLSVTAKAPAVLQGSAGSENFLYLARLGFGQHSKFFIPFHSPKMNFIIFLLVAYKYSLASLFLVLWSLLACFFMRKEFRVCPHITSQFL